MCMTCAEVDVYQQGCTKGLTSLAFACDGVFFDDAFACLPFESAVALSESCFRVCGVVGVLLIQIEAFCLLFSMAWL